MLSEMKILASPNTKVDHSCATRMLECLLLHCVRLFLHTCDRKVKCSLCQWVLSLYSRHAYTTCFIPTPCCVQGGCSIGKSLEIVCWGKYRHIKAFKKTCLVMTMRGPADGEELLLAVQEEIKQPYFIAPVVSNLPCLSESISLPLSLSHFSWQLFFTNACNTQHMDSTPYYSQYMFVWHTDTGNRSAEPASLMSRGNADLEGVVMWPIGLVCHGRAV